MWGKSYFKLLGSIFLSPLLVSALLPKSAFAEVVALSCSNAERQFQLVLDYNKKEAVEYFASGLEKRRYYLLEFPDVLYLTLGDKDSKLAYAWRVDRYSLETVFEKSSKQKSSKRVPVEKFYLRCSKVPFEDVVRGKKRQI